MFYSLFLQILSGIVGLWVAEYFVVGVQIIGNWQMILLAGAALGAVNFFVKPVVNVITFPLKLLTFGLFTIVVNMGMVWIIDILFPELIIDGIIPLFWTAIVVWILSIILSLFGRGKI